MSTGVTVGGAAALVTSGITIVGDDTGGIVELGMASITGEDAVGEILWSLQAAKYTNRSKSARTFESCFMQKTFLLGLFTRDQWF
jgi:hypothetical protein